jgi:hypothetical protein
VDTLPLDFCSDTASGHWEKIGNGRLIWETIYPTGRTVEMVEMILDHPDHGKAVEMVETMNYDYGHSADLYQVLREETYKCFCTRRI